MLFCILIWPPNPELLPHVCLRRDFYLHALAPSIRCPACPGERGESCVRFNGQEIPRRQRGRSLKGTKGLGNLAGSMCACVCVPRLTGKQLHCVDLPVGFPSVPRHYYFQARVSSSFSSYQCPEPCALSFFPEGWKCNHADSSWKSSAQLRREDTKAGLLQCLPWFPKSYLVPGLCGRVGMSQPQCRVSLAPQSLNCAG